MDNAQLIRSPGKGVKRKEPKHRVVEAKHLRPALRMVQTDVDDRLGVGPFESSSAGMMRMPTARASLPPERSMSMGLTNAVPYGSGGMMNMLGPGNVKPLPSLPPLHMPQHYSHSPQEMYGRTFSPMTPSFTSASPPMSPPCPSGYEQGYMNYYNPNGHIPDSTRGEASLFSLRGLRDALPSLMPRRRNSGYGNSDEMSSMGPRGASFPQRPYPHSGMSSINELLPVMSGDIQPPLQEPVDNLNLYLRKAVIERWDKWMDPDEREAMMMERGRWQARGLWGTGPPAPLARSGSAFHGESPRAKTIDRLVSSVMSYRDDTTGSTERGLKQWMQRKSFFRAIEQGA
jgi:hypothetical protein